jgi:hypothetical protein
MLNPRFHFVKQFGEEPFDLRFPQSELWSVVLTHHRAGKVGEPLTQWNFRFELINLISPGYSAGSGQLTPGIGLLRNWLGGAELDSVGDHSQDVQVRENCLASQPSQGS